MDIEKLTSLIAFDIPVSDIASALNVTDRVILREAENHKDLIAQKVLERLAAPVEQTASVNELLTETLSAIRNAIPHADISELTSTLNALSKLQSSKETTDSQVNNTTLTHNAFYLNTLISNQPFHAKVDNSGEVREVAGRTMLPMSISQLKESFNEQPDKINQSNPSVEIPTV